ncbi:hypothetical protein [Schaedlerella arabinosiphila]|mgnify:FL=1|jgi:hypothetical protein|uniref:hypothetical protein n=1 Tax=Schaedlerella arabinosiphila TaxID=2044587 RepID=UPI0002CB5B87|nr:hypothetical protein [Schaedlerella arabinosiphila]KAI4441928.1 hypothetical protein C824_004437 [Schaedlerella arabinosiphila]
MKLNNKLTEYNTSNQTKIFVPCGEEKEYQEAYKNFIAILSDIIAKHSEEFAVDRKKVA